MIYLFTSLTLHQKMKVYNTLMTYFAISDYHWSNHCDIFLWHEAVSQSYHIMMIPIRVKDNTHWSLPIRNICCKAGSRANTEKLSEDNWLLRRSTEARCVSPEKTSPFSSLNRSEVRFTDWKHLKLYYVYDHTRLCSLRDQAEWLWLSVNTKTFYLLW